MKVEDHPMRAVIGLNCIWHRVIENQMADLGLTSIQSRMMGYIYIQSRTGNKVLQKEMEKEFQIRKSSVTSVIQVLERKGLIRRMSVLEDARQKELVLTDTGVAVQEKVIRRLDALEEMVNETMTLQERQIWLSCIRKIETRLKEAEYD